MKSCTITDATLQSAHDLWRRIDADRLRELTLAFLAVPSPTGDESAFAEHFAAALRQVPMSVQVTRRYPKSPNVIARHDFARPGRTLQLDVHLYVIDIPNPAHH